MQPSSPSNLTPGRSVDAPYCSLFWACSLEPQAFFQNPDDSWTVHDNATQSPVETECITLVTDKLDAVRLRIVILDELSNWPQQGILVQFSIVSPGSDNVMYMLLPTRSSNIFTMFPRHSPLPFVILSASAELNP